MLRASLRLLPPKVRAIRAKNVISVFDIFDVDRAIGNKFLTHHTYELFVRRNPNHPLKSPRLLCLLDFVHRKSFEVLTDGIHHHKVVLFLLNFRVGVCIIASSFFFFFVAHPSVGNEHVVDGFSASSHIDVVESTWGRHELYHPIWGVDLEYSSAIFAIIGHTVFCRHRLQRQHIRNTVWVVVDRHAPQIPDKVCLCGPRVAMHNDWLVSLPDVL